MSSNKKRKHQIVDSDDDDVQPITIDDSEEEVKPTKKRASKDDSQKRKKRVVIESDEDDNSISINDIKKKAKSKAKKLAKNDDSGDESKPAKGSNQKTPPVKQSNTLFKYFKPLDVKKKDEQSDKTKESSESKVTASKDLASKKILSGEMFTTTLTKNKPIVDTEPRREQNKLPKIKDVSGSLKSKESTSSKQNSPKKVQLKPDQIDQPKNEQVQKRQLSPKKETKVREEPPKTKIQPSKSKEEIKSDFVKTVVKVESPKKKSPMKDASKPVDKTLEAKPKQKIPEALPRIVEAKLVSDLWVDKYKPANIKQVIGQQGDRSPLNKLLKWLRYWHQNLDKKPGFGRGASDDGAGFRAALLSGPPGIGKTTTAQIVCKELGYDFLELNASDSRNKKSLQEDVRDVLANTKLTNFFQSNASSSAQSDQRLTAKHCVIMDEVDGMAGNEDRGGIAELILLIKKTKVPLICICNDRSHPKMRSLVNYCFDIRFPKPRIEHIKGPLMSIAFKENIKISPNVLSDLIASSNFDIRQCIHNLSMLGAGHTTISNMINSKDNAKPIKDVKLGPFDAIRKVFATGEEYALMSFADKSDLFFTDYSIMPLFVYENYHTINLSSKEPSVAKQLKSLYKTIDSISRADLIEKDVRTNQNWSLLPLQAAFSTVMPGAYMRSANGLGFPQFPQFMGKLSTTNKNNRLIDELVAHMTLSITGTRTSFALDYLEPLRDSLIQPLLESDKEGISAVLDLMEHYSLTKDNMDSILELSQWTGDTDPMKKIDSKTKAALTREYNKKDFTLCYPTEDIRVVTKKGAKGKAGKAKKLKANSLVKMDSEESDAAASEHEPEDDELMDFY